MGRKKKTAKKKLFQFEKTRIVDKDDNVIETNEGYAPAAFEATRYDVLDEVTNMDSYRYGRDNDNYNGHAGLNFGDY
jgi:hypothetical protein